MVRGRRGESGSVGLRCRPPFRAGVAFLETILTKGILPTQVVPELKKRKEKLERDVSRILNAPVKASALSEFPSLRCSSP